MGLRLEWIVRIEDLKNAGKGNRVLQSRNFFLTRLVANCAPTKDYLGGGRVGHAGGLVLARLLMAN